MPRDRVFGYTPVHDMNGPRSRKIQSAQSTMTDAKAAASLDALRVLAEQPDLSQRELSVRLGLSLGKTHYVLHALLDKGLLKIKNFKRSDNKLGYAYLLTPMGLKEKLRLTRGFLARKESEFELLRTTIAQLRQELSHASVQEDQN